MRLLSRNKATNELLSAQTRYLDLLTAVKVTSIDSNVGKDSTLYLMAIPIAYSAWEGDFKVVMSLCLRRLHDSQAAATTYKAKASALWYMKSSDYQSFRTKLNNSNGSNLEEMDKVGKGLYQSTSDLLSTLPGWLSSPLQTPVGGHDKLVMTFSNVNPDVVKVNAEAIDLDLTKVELGRLHQLVQQRNEIGHGGLFSPPGEKELGEVIKYTQDLIKSFNRAALRWLKRN